MAEVPCLLVSELVTNAVVHTGTWVGLELRLVGRRLRSAVSDESSRVPVPRRCEASDSAGRGLHVVEELAGEWGVEPTDAGKTVWFEVDLALSDRLQWARAQALNVARLRCTLAAFFGPGARLTMRLLPDSVTRLRCDLGSRAPGCGASRPCRSREHEPMRSVLIRRRSERGAGRALPFNGVRETLQRALELAQRGLGSPLDAVSPSTLFIIDDYSTLLGRVGVGHLRIGARANDVVARRRARPRIGEVRRP